MVESKYCSTSENTLNDTDLASESQLYLVCLLKNVWPKHRRLWCNRSRVSMINVALLAYLSKNVHEKYTQFRNAVVFVFICFFFVRVFLFVYNSIHDHKRAWYTRFVTSWILLKIENGMCHGISFLSLNGVYQIAKWFVYTLRHVEKSFNVWLDTDAGRFDTEWNA